MDNGVSCLSPETVRDLVDTLRTIRGRFDRYLRIDALDMAHVEKALARVDIEQSFARQARYRETRLHAAES